MILSRSLRANRNFSYSETLFHHLMIGMGESYFAAFALALGLSESKASWLTSVPVGIGALLQFLTLKFLAHTKNHKWLVTWMALIQALVFLPLMWLALTVRGHFSVLTIVISLYWFAAFSYGPAWNYWISKILGGSESRSFFAHRSRLQQLGIFCGLIGAGYLLKMGSTYLSQMHLFIFVFACAAFFRLLSVVALLNHDYQKQWSENVPSKSIRESIQLFWRKKERRNFFLSLVPFTFCIHLTAPLVHPYLLKQVKLPYDQYSLVVAALLIGKVISTFIIQNKFSHWEPKKLLFLGAIGAAPLPIFWALSENFYFMCLLQIFSGATWVFYDVGLSLYFYSDLNDEEKVVMFTSYNALNSFAILAGGYAGSHILHYLGETKSSYYLMFLSGGVIRGLVALLVRQKNLRSSSEPLLRS